MFLLIQVKNKYSLDRHKSSCKECCFNQSLRKMFSLTFLYLLSAVHIIKEILYSDAKVINMSILMKINFFCTHDHIIVSIILDESSRHDNLDFSKFFLRVC